MIQLTKDDILESASELLKCGKDRLSIKLRTKIGGFDLIANGTDTIYFALNLRVLNDTIPCDCRCDDSIIYRYEGGQTCLYEGIYLHYLQYLQYTRYDILEYLNADINHFFTQANFYEAQLNYFEIKRI